MRSHITLLHILAAFVGVAISQQCYGLDGTALDNTYAPCNPNAKHSGCCATKRSSGVDLCLDNGLCMSTRDELMGMIWQSGCTDAMGKDVACPRMCPGVNNDFGGLEPVQAWNVQQCDYGKYCCRAINDRQSCCNNATAPKVITSTVGAFQLQLATATQASISPTQAVATAISTGSPFDATGSTGSKDCKKERHQTAVVGGTIGGLFGAVIVGLMGALYWTYKQEKRQKKLKEHYEEQFSQTAAYRRTIASSAISLIHSEAQDNAKRKSSDV
ncbi:hypothetical protein EK21DRAFT_109787 [Setomelanomma holmii]|uniref:Uncharacterized protein n=1 Tax=Setomelanomma holmii TaxID=210430 RepID=A0A9P4HGR0_9PLEO|nr:hypothetical protein EK21DRAFT_109787 [Setomelanomma holmii]